MDIMHACRANPLQPAYAPDWREPRAARRPAAAALDCAGGLVEIGHAGAGFAFDNEAPRHRVCSQPFALADRLVTNGDWLGVHRRRRLPRGPSSGCRDGWAACAGRGLGGAALLGAAATAAGRQFALGGLRPLDPGRAGLPRQLLRGRRLRALGRRAAADRGGVGGGRLPRVPGCRATRPRIGWEWTGQRLPALSRLPPAGRARSASTTASSWSTRWCCAAARCATPPGHTRAELPQLLPARAALAVQRRCAWRRMRHERRARPRRGGGRSAPRWSPMRWPACPRPRKTLPCK